MAFPDFACNRQALQSLTALRARTSAEETQMCRCKHSRNLIDNGQIGRIAFDRRRGHQRRSAICLLCGSPRIYLLQHEPQLSQGPDGLRINTILAAAGYNFGLLLHWLAGLLRASIVALT